MRIIHCGLLLAALAVAGCGRGDSAFGPEDERFVETMVALRRAAQASGGDAANYTALKAGVLRDRGVTEEQLRAYIETRVRNLDHLAAVWESINVRLAAPEAEPQ